MRQWMAVTALVLVGCSSGSGGGINYGLPACAESYPADYSLSAEFNGGECAFFIGIANTSGTVVCECPQPAPMAYCGAQVPAFTGKCPPTQPTP